MIKLRFSSTVGKHISVKQSAFALDVYNSNSMSYFDKAVFLNTLIQYSAQMQNLVLVKFLVRPKDLELIADQAWDEIEEYSQKLSPDVFEAVKKLCLFYGKSVKADLFGF